MKIKTMVGEIQKRIKLRRMEKAIGIKLTRIQRKEVLRQTYPMTYNWPRRSGKSLCACLWILLHRKEPIRYVTMHDPSVFPNWDRINKYSIPDPDNGISREAERLTYKMLMGFKRDCDRKHIKTCEVIPMNNINRSALGVTPPNLKEAGKHEDQSDCKPR